MKLFVKKSYLNIMDAMFERYARQISKFIKDNQVRDLSNARKTSLKTLLWVGGLSVAGLTAFFYDY